MRWARVRDCMKHAPSYQMLFFPWLGAERGGEGHKGGRKRGEEARKGAGRAYIHVLL